LTFRTDEISFRIADRLLAPNTTDTFAAVKPELEAFLRKLLGSATFQLEHKASAEKLFEVGIKSATTASVSDLLGRLGTSVTSPIV
jgi:hypothetical protein